MHYVTEIATENHIRITFSQINNKIFKYLFKSTLNYAYILFCLNMSILNNLLIVLTKMFLLLNSKIYTTSYLYKLEKLE